MSQRILDLKSDWQYLHVVFKTFEKGHKSDEFMFNHETRLFFIQQMLRFLRLYSPIKLLNFCVLSGHAHCCFAVPKQHEVSLKETAESYQICYGRKMDARSKACLTLNQNLNNISKFVQSFERDFAHRYNKRCGCKRRGSLWVPKFHNTLLCSDKALLRCWNYVLLNSVKAGLVKRPHEDDCGSWGCEADLKQECLKNLYEHYSRLHAAFNGTQPSLENFVKLLEAELANEEVVYSELTVEDFEEMSDFWYHHAVGDAETLERVVGKKRTRHLTPSKRYTKLMAC